jgi:DNA-binding beta-propeller fold protein YncE
VAVVDADGRVVRHLAAGMLGPNAPAPLAKDSLAQRLTWDRRDDRGRPAEGGPFRVRVRAGSRPHLERIVGWDGNTIGHREFVVGMTVGPERELYVLLAEQWHGRSEVRIFGPDGRYRRTILPYPAHTPPERTDPIGTLTIDGARQPIVFNGHGHTLAPLVAGMKKQTCFFSPKGHLVLASAVGSLQEHGPPRHLLALHPEGGAPPETGFVGPRLMQPRGFMGGAGESGAPWFDHLATSPDGRWIYVTLYGESYKFTQRHAVFRLAWSDEALGSPFLGAGQAGSGDAHFNDPQGLAVDARGHLYVCDRGNNRVMIFAADGRLRSSFAVPDPEQIQVHPQTGTMYVVSRKPGKRVKETTLRKFTAWTGGAPREAARLDGLTVDIIALDAAASPPRLWAALATGYRKAMDIVPVTDQGERLEVGESITNEEGLGHPMFIAVDAARQRAYVTEFNNVQKRVDLATGAVEPFKQGNEAAVDADGNVYLTGGYEIHLERYDPEGKPLPFAAIGTHKIGLPDYKAKGPHIGLRGHTVAPSGDIYILRMGFYWRGQMDVYGPDGRMTREGLLERVVHGCSGFGVDAAGHVYLAANLKPAEGPVLPDYFAGKAPAEPWVWWRKVDREPPWSYPYYNPYLYHLGCVLKFPPTGGAFYGGRSRQIIERDEKEGRPGDPPVPAEAKPYKTGYLNVDAAVEGAEWRYAGCSPVPATGLNWGDPACTCWTSRLAVDPYGRVYVPNVFRSAVEVIDSEANLIARVGRYGNADSAGPGSRVPQPPIPFAWPAFLATADGRLYVSDPVNRRVAVIAFDHDAEATCRVP